MLVVVAGCKMGPFHPQHRHQLLQLVHPRPLPSPPPLPHRHTLLRLVHLALDTSRSPATFPRLYFIQSTVTKRILAVERWLTFKVAEGFFCNSWKRFTHSTRCSLQAPVNDLHSGSRSCLKKESSRFFPWLHWQGVFLLKIFWVLRSIVLKWLKFIIVGSNIPLADYELNRIYNKILDHDWFFARLFVT